MRGAITILDGPLGTELSAKGIATPAPGWSAYAIDTAADAIRDIHAAYRHAGAHVHTANTFRTQRRYFPRTWRALVRRAVELAREGASGGRIAGSLAPLEDCYRPDLSPADAIHEHREVARALADEGVDLILCETFPHLGEASAATIAAIETGLPTWVSFTSGPRNDLLTPDDIARGARAAAKEGATAVLVNCLPTKHVATYLDALADAGLPFGAYANAGEPDATVSARRGTEPSAVEPDPLTWVSSGETPTSYAEAARRWIERGATIVGACCGTGPAHIAALAELASASTGRQ